MAKPIQIGGSDFAKIIRKGALFVDKTLFIKEIINDQSDVTLITRPRRWGKTLNLSMLHYFLSAEIDGQKTAGLFDQLLIAKEPGDYIAKHQGQYPVIFISLKDVKMFTFEQALEKIQSLIQSAYQKHRVLLTQQQQPLAAEDKQLFVKHLNKQVSEIELTESLLFLSKLLYEYHKQKVYILIDEYDTPMNFARTHDYFNHMALFMKNFLGASLKDNRYLEKAVMTGILRISKDSMLSGLNNPQIYTVLKDDRYAPYFGFTDEELDPLFADQNLVKNEAEVKAWYNGYCINGLTLYNPWSIMCCLDHKADIVPYWLNTGDDSLLKELLQNATTDIKQQFQELVLGNAVTVSVNQTMRFDEVATDKSMLWNLLVSAGYLTVRSANRAIDQFICELMIPNQEVLGLYKSMFLQWLSKTTDPIEIRSFVSLLGEGKINEFEQHIERFLKMAASVHDYAHQPEAFYQGFMLALTVSLMDRYYIFSNHESGLGRPDLIMIPKGSPANQAVILEFKTVTGKQKLQKRAQEALKQIQARDYDSIIGQYPEIKTILQVGMAFDGKTVRCVQQSKNA